MYISQKITAFANKNKSIIWGLFLSTIIFRFALANIFLALIAAIFFIQWFHNKTIVFNKNVLPIAIYFLWGAASLLWTTNPSNTIQGIEMTLPLILFPIFISQYSIFSHDDLSKTIRVFSLCLLIYFLICIVNAGILFLQDKQFDHFFYHSLVTTFNNNAIYISLAVAICILYIFNLQLKKPADYYILIALGVFLLLLASKNLIVTTFLLLILSLFKNKDALKTAAIISFALLALAVFLMFTDNPIKDRFLIELNLNLNHVLKGQDFYAYNFSGIEIRIFQWRMMAEMIANNQVGVLSLGLHNVDYLLNQYFNYYNLYKGYFHINFHNQFLQTFGEIGYLGLLLLLGIFIASISNVIRAGNKYKVLFVILFLSSFFTESFLSRQKGIFLFATIYGLLFMDKNSTEKESLSKVDDFNLDS